MHPMPARAKRYASLWVIASRAAVVVAVVGLARAAIASPGGHFRSGR